MDIRLIRIDTGITIPGSGGSLPPATGWRIINELPPEFNAEGPYVTDSRLPGFPVDPVTEEPIFYDLASLNAGMSGNGRWLFTAAKFDQGRPAVVVWRYDPAQENYAFHSKIDDPSDPETPGNFGSGIFVDEGGSTLVITDNKPRGVSNGYFYGLENDVYVSKGSGSFALVQDGDDRGTVTLSRDGSILVNAVLNGAKVFERSTTGAFNELQDLVEPIANYGLNAWKVDVTPNGSNINLVNTNHDGFPISLRYGRSSLAIGTNFVPILNSENPYFTTNIPFRMIYTADRQFGLGQLRSGGGVAVNIVLFDTSNPVAPTPLFTFSSRDGSSDENWGTDFDLSDDLETVIISKKDGNNVASRATGYVDVYKRTATAPGVYEYTHFQKISNGLMTQTSADFGFRVFMPFGNRFMIVVGRGQGGDPEYMDERVGPVVIYK